MLDQIDYLYRLQKNDLRCGAAVLADAFHHDPIWSELMADAPLKSRQAAFAGPLRYY